MEILKTTDGVLWVRQPDAAGWVHLTEADLDPGDLLSELIKQKLNKKKDLSYSMAFSEVQKENSELARTYLEQVRYGGSIKQKQRVVKKGREKQMEKEHVEWDPGDFLSKATKWEMEEHKDLSFAEAFTRVQKKYPEMAKRCQDQVRGNWPPRNWVPVK